MLGVLETDNDISIYKIAYFISLCHYDLYGLVYLMA